MANPVINPAVRLFADESGYLAYNSDADRLYEINASGALVAELCDGSRTVDEIRALVAPIMPEGQAEVVERFVKEGLESRLLVFEDRPPVHPRELSSEELTNLAEHLRDCGQIESALRCAKKVTQLTPGDPVAWHHLGRVAQAAGHRRVAREAFENYLAQRPEDAAIGHLMIALRDQPPPPRASNECILQSFSDFASHYDCKMRDQLSYQAPERLQELIWSELRSATRQVILDLGCGTGLAGVGLKPRAARLDGIDLSPEMIEMARARGIYDSLEVAEITDWLARGTSHFDLIVACDCFVYFGDLGPVTRLAAKRLKPGGCFAFTVERGEKHPFHLTDSGRFAHDPDHIYEIAAVSGLSLARLDDGFLRTEAGAEVVGLVALFRKPAGP